MARPLLCASLCECVCLCLGMCVWQNKWKMERQQEITILEKNKVQVQRKRVLKSKMAAAVKVAVSRTRVN